MTQLLKKNKDDNIHKSKALKFYGFVAANARLLSPVENSQKKQIYIVRESIYNILPFSEENIWFDKNFNSKLFHIVIVQRLYVLEHFYILLISITMRIK